MYLHKNNNCVHIVLQETFAAIEVGYRKVRDRFCVRCKGWVKSRIKQVADIDRILEKTN